jgi:hypothetical protein
MDRHTMDVGGAATLTAAFKDAHGDDVKPARVDWGAGSELALTPDPKDPAKCVAIGLSAGTTEVRADFYGDNGARAVATAMVAILEKGAPVQGSIDFSATPAPAKAAPAHDESKAAPAHDDPKPARAHH